ncbi:hypothetical protein ACIO6T_31090 [Streptomyces sp. NPDC087532]
MTQPELHGLENPDLRYVWTGSQPLFPKPGGVRHAPYGSSRRT